MTYSGAYARWRNSDTETVTEWSRLWAPSLLSKVSTTTFTPSEELTPIQNLLQKFMPRFEVKNFTMDELDAATEERVKHNPKLIGQTVKVEVKASAVRYATARHCFSNYDSLLKEFTMHDAGRTPEAYPAFKDAFNRFIEREHFSA